VPKDKLMKEIKRMPQRKAVSYAYGKGNKAPNQKKAKK